MPFNVVYNNVGLLASGIALTVLISVASILAGMLIGVAVAVARMSPSRALRSVAGAYVEVIRNTPVLVQIFLLYLGLPEFGLRPSPLAAVVIALAVNNGAYLGEIIRGGLQAVPRGQLEAAAAIGLPRRTTFFEILLPQALRTIFPALTNQFILTVLASSIGSIVGAPELTQQVQFLDSRSFRTIELLIFLAAAYAVMTSAVSRVSRSINARLDKAFLV